MQLSHFFTRCFGVCLVVFLLCSLTVGAATYYVDDNAVTDPGPYDPNVSSPLEDGSADYPFDRIQEGIDAADPNNTIIVSPGTYYENIRFNGKNIILTSTDPEDPAIVESTIIDGNANGSVVTFLGSETSACVLRGFTIGGGYTHDGGGISGAQTRAVIEHCLITGNRSRSIGGGLYDCDGLISNCIIIGNISRYGGGLYDCDGRIINCVITGNIVAGRGGGAESCDGSITNCTIVGNKADYRGGGLSICKGSITNCIIDLNDALNSGDQLYDCSRPSYSFIQDWTGGGIGNVPSDPNNLIIDPLFADLSSSDPNDWDLHLLPGSLCVDGGTNTPSGGLTATDLDGNPRVFDGDFDGEAVVDMGAYEFHEFPDEAYLSVRPQQISFTAFEDGSNPASQMITLQNMGHQVLNWSMDLSDKPDWLTVSSTSGVLAFSESGTITLSVDITGLSGGTYSYSLQLSDPVAQNSPQTVAVNLTVTGPILGVSKNTFSFSAFENGDSPADQVLSVRNLGGAMVNWSITASNKPDWLAITPTSGSLTHNESDAVTLSVDSTGLTGGQYSYSFQVSDAAAANSPQIVTMNLTVTGPILDVSETEFSFTVLEAGVNPADQTFTVVNSGGGTLNWSLVFNDKPSWLTVTPAGGNLAQNEADTVTLSVDSSGLTGGRYSYSFTVTDPAAANNPQMVTLDLTVGGDLIVPGSYPTIQAAIDAAFEGVTITVMPGTYYENITFNGKNITLTSVDPENPAIVAFTIIDGNQNGSVVTFSGSETPACQLRGFTITNGDYGGIRGHGTEATISKCIIHNNDIYGSSNMGGGVNDCDGTIVNCIISQNRSWGWQETEWTGEWYDGRGGGLVHCDGVIANCTIVDNWASTWGDGLIYCNGIITNCIIWNSIINSSMPTYSCFSNWTGVGTGNIGSDPLFADVANGDYHLKSEYGRWDNSNSQWVYDTVTSPCIDAGMPLNEAAGDPNIFNDWREELWPHGERINMGAYGGTPQASMSGDPVGNAADLNHDDAVGAGDFALFCEDWLMAENLLAADLNRNGIVDIADFSVFAQQWLWEQGPILDVSKTQFSWVSYEGTVNPDPQYLNVRNLGVELLNWSITDINEPTLTLPGWLTVTPVSGFLDSNENEDVTVSVDITGLSDGQYSYTFEVSDPSARNSPKSVTIQLFIRGDYIVVPDGVASIQTAIDCIAENGTIVVMPGTYTENLVFPGRDFTLTSTDPEDPNIVASTIIDGNQNGSVVTFAGSETSDCLLTGFTITNGYASGSFLDNSGGGIYGNDAQVSIEYCTITGNTAGSRGGGLDDCDGSISNCTITGNTGLDGGGLDGCNGSITNCTITGNTAGDIGGGLFYCNGSITNCTITGNTANDDGGGLSRCNGSITNCTITGNTAGDIGGGLYDCDGSITNCIVWSNSAGGSGDQIYFYHDVIPTYSCIQDWSGGGVGNIAGNPLFANTSSTDPADWDLHLLSGSPCIDAGTNTPPGGLPATDKDDNPRILDGDTNDTTIVDIGVYEFVP